MYRRRNAAVSELLGIIYTLMIATTVISAIYAWAPARIEEAKVAVRGMSTQNQLEMIDNAIQNMITHGAGSSSTATLVTDKGYVHVGNQGTIFFGKNGLINWG